MEKLVKIRILILVAVIIGLLVGAFHLSTHEVINGEIYSVKSIDLDKESFREMAEEVKEKLNLEDEELYIIGAEDSLGRNGYWPFTKTDQQVYNFEVCSGHGTTYAKMVFMVQKNNKVRMYQLAFQKDSWKIVRLIERKPWKFSDYRHTLTLTELGEILDRIPFDEIQKTTGEFNKIDQTIVTISRKEDNLISKHKFLKLDENDRLVQEDKLSYKMEYLKIETIDGLDKRTTWIEIKEK